MIINANNLKKDKPKETYAQYMERISPERNVQSPRGNNSPPPNRTKFIPRLSPRAGSGQNSPSQSPKRNEERLQSQPSSNLNSAYLKAGEKNQ